MIDRLRDILDGALRSAGLETTSDAWRIHDVWPDAVGSRVAAHATPISLTRGELMVAVPDSVWRQELALLAPEMIVRLNGAVGADVVQRVRLVGGAFGMPDEPRSRRRVIADDRAPGPSSADPPSSGIESVPDEIANALGSLRSARNTRVTQDLVSRAATKRRP